MGFFWKSLEFDGEPIEVGQRPLRGLPAARVAIIQIVLRSNICQVLLWAPQAWTNGTIQPTSQQILQWTMTMATKVIYECKFSNSPAAQAEYQLVLSILSRFTIRKIKNALYWITHDGK